jgi:hypothetical protein
MVWCLYRYLVLVLNTQKRTNPLTGGLVVRERAQNHPDLKLCVYQLIEGRRVGKC